MAIQALRTARMGIVRSNQGQEEESLLLHKYFSTLELTKEDDKSRNEKKAA